MPKSGLDLAVLDGSFYAAKSLHKIQKNDCKAFKVIVFYCVLFTI